jgi:hypothetical protein
MKPFQAKHDCLKARAFFPSGYLAQGQYFVALPDGRIQTVTYHADGNGYVADVQYQGQAVYPEVKPVYVP